MDFSAFTAEGSPWPVVSQPASFASVADSHLAHSSLLAAGPPEPTLDELLWPGPFRGAPDQKPPTSRLRDPPRPHRPGPSDPVAYTPYDFARVAGTGSGLLYPANDEFFAVHPSFSVGSDGGHNGHSGRPGIQRSFPSTDTYFEQPAPEKATHGGPSWMYSTFSAYPAREATAFQPAEQPLQLPTSHLCDIRETDYGPLLSGDAGLELPTPPPPRPSANRAFSSLHSPRTASKGLHLPGPPPELTEPEPDGAEEVEQVTPFISKLVYLLQHKQYEPWVRWDSTGQYLLVAHTKPHLLVILEKFFRHTVISSFIRQLNIYGFRRASTAILLGVLEETDYATSAVVPNRCEPELFSASDFSAFHTAGFFRSEEGGPQCRLSALKPIAKERPPRKRSYSAKTSSSAPRNALPRRKSSSSSSAASRKRSLASSDSDYEG
ncbi:hypothetical protein JCM3774_002075 [Rhodotorula dairenensis]